MKFYLSGGMEFKKGLGKNWRVNLTEKLEQLGHEALDPVKMELDNAEAANFDWKANKQAEDLTLYREMVRKHMFRKDMAAIQKSDATILLYDESVRKGAGTLAEAWECFREGKPVYLITEFTREEVPGWLIGETTRIFRTPGQVVDYIRDTTRVQQDIKEAKTIRDRCLGGIY
jgi:nucleoside 2-deoxyribosyltransferase